MADLDPYRIPKGIDGPHVQELFDLYTFSERETFQTTRGFAEGWRASQMGYCVRRQYLKRVGVPSLKGEPDEASRRTLAWGDAIHYFTKNLFRRGGLYIAEEVKLRDEMLDLTGTFDVEWGGELQPYELPDSPTMWDLFLDKFRTNIYDYFGEQVPVSVTEIKSAKSYALEKAKAGDVNPAYREQLASYYILGTMHPDQLPVYPDRWNLLLVGKESGDMVTLELEQREVDRVWSKLNQLAEAWSGTASPNCSCWQDGPERKSKKYPWTVEYCEYFDGVGDCCADDLLDDAEALRQREVAS